MSGPPAVIDPMTVIHEYFAAFEERNLERCLEFYGDGASVHFQFGDYDGRDAIASWHRERFAADLRVTHVDDMVVDGDTVNVAAVVASARLRSWKLEHLGVTRSFTFDAGRIRNLVCSMRELPW